MDILTTTNMAVGAVACAYAATVYGLTKYQHEDERPFHMMAGSIKHGDKDEMMKIPLDSKESLRSEERKADLRNHVMEVDSFLKDTDSKEVPNPMVVNESQQVLPGRFLTYKSCIPTGAFTIGDRQYKSEKELLAATRYKKAGPKAHLYYDPDKVKAAIVTCGGICPGENVVIRELVRMLWYGYGVHEIYGVKYGFEGFGKMTEEGDCYIKLMPDLPPNLKEIPKRILAVKDLHTKGGTVLGSSRGGFDAERVIASLQKHGINQLYAIGGDGTHRGLLALSKVLKQRKIEVALVGMNICLIPEVPFDAYGPKGLLEYVMRRLKERGHCVIVVAEGAGVALRDVTLEQTAVRDPSGNLIPPVLSAM